MIEAIFKAYDIRGKVPDELTPDLAHAIGRAVADYLPTAGRVAVGYDMRPDSFALAAAVREGLLAQGRPVIDLGQVTSDMVYFAVGKLGLAGGLMVTASHNPGKDNGIKIYRDEVWPVGLDSGLADIRDAVIARQFKPRAKASGSQEKYDLTEEWVEHCLGFLRAPLKPFRIAIDAGNGMAGKILPVMEAKLPIHVHEMYYELDGTFPNHEANPSKSENLKDLIQVIQEKRLDFGIAFDGDGDRAVFVDNLGRPVLGTDLISLIAKAELARHPGAEIVHDVRTSRATRELIQEWGGRPYRTKAGRVTIGRVMRERGAPFGAETTGHMFFEDNYSADSGMITALVAMAVLSESNQKLSEIVDSYRRYVMPPELNYRVKDPMKLLAALAARYSDAEQDRLDGLTVEYPDWWFNLRVSNTEPLVRLNIEARNQKILDEKLAEIVMMIEEEK